MKKIKHLIAASLIVTNVIAQQPPTPNPATDPSTGLAGPQKGTVAWYRGGNVPVGPATTNNIFGTLWNSPIYTVTDGQQRTRLNGTLVSTAANPLNGVVGQNTSGYFGISPQGFFANNSPWAMLHLDGPNNTGFNGDWRSWMKTGVYMRENSDAMYVGLKDEFSNSGLNRSDAVINWSDDPTSGGGVDKLRFLFTSTAPNGSGSGTDPRNGASFNGYEFMRMQSFPAVNNGAGFPIGHVGIGPMFTNALPPQNRLHMNAEDNLANFLQISNTTGTGQGALDGLHIGYPSTTPTFLTAQINQKENDNLLLLTNQGERIRVSHIGNVSVANMNPGGIPNNRTRVSISHDPLNPVTRPLSLLHLGYNTGALSFPPGSTDGWRSWMDIGMFTSNGTDNVYIGLKNEGTTDRNDAVISWGDNQINTGIPVTNGPDNFRFIFTSTNGLTGGGTPPATGPNGLEGLRMTPTTANGVYTGIGGAPTVNPYSTGLNPGNTTEINSWGATTAIGGSSGLRFTNLTIASPTIANPGTGVLSVDANGDVIYVPGGGGNGLGNVCGASTTNPLTNNWEIPLGTATTGHNFLFSGQGLTNYNVGIGTTCAPIAKLDVLEQSGNANSIGINVSNADVNGTGVNVYTKGSMGVKSIARQRDPISLQSIGVYGEADWFSSTKGNIGVYGVAKNNATDDNIGGFFITSTPGVLNNIGTIGYANNGNNNTGGIFQAISSNPSSGNNYGIQALAWGPSLNPNIAIYSQVDINRPQDFAAKFDGAVSINGVGTITGGTWGGSDQLFKTQIDTISNAMNIIKSLKPKQFYFDTTNVYGLHFSSKKQYGLIAQDVEQILPELVGRAHQDAQRDTSGNIITQATDYKTVNYNALFGIMLKGMQEQQTKIDSLTKQLNSKDSVQDARLTALENAIAQCCSSASARNANSNINQLDIELSDKDAIVLNQNVPNPFAEQTTITYNVPASVEKAQLIFFNANGQVIQTVDIKTRGKGKVNVFASDLSSGLYHYTLVADGKVVDSKKMVRE